MRKDHCGCTPLIDSYHIESSSPRRWLYLYRNPRTFRIDEGFNIKQSGIRGLLRSSRSIAGFSGLPRNHDEREKQRPCGYPIRPCERIDPIWRVMGLICFACAMVCIAWGDRRLWTTRLAIIGMIGLAVFCIAGHTENCRDQEYEQDHRPILDRQSFQHNSAIVPQKPLDMI